IELIKNIVEQEFLDITKSIIPTEVDKLSLGTSGFYLNSIFELLHSLNILLSEGLIESAGSVATSLWERSITLQYFLTNHIEFANIISTHKKYKKTPWNIKEMVIGIVNSENHKERDPEIMKDLLYIQYSYLCAIKHGNPYTLSYLNRLEKNTKSVIGLNPNFTEEDWDIKNYLQLISLTLAFESLLKFSSVFCTNEKYSKLKIINLDITTTIVRDIKLNVPQIITTTSEEFREEFWEYLKGLK